MKAFDKNTSMGEVSDKNTSMGGLGDELNIQAGIVSAKQDAEAPEFDESDQNPAADQ